MEPPARIHQNGHRKPLRLLHTADIHVGSDVYPKEALLGFDAVLEAVRAYSADALLIAGDLFDSRKVATEDVSYVFEALAGLGRPVVILPGNHDTLLTSSASIPASMPPNMFVLRDPLGEVATMEALDLSVWGRPVYDHVPSFRPLEGLQPRPNEGWYVVLGHGLVMDDSIHVGRSSPISLAELEQADCDYVALGHVHRFLDVTQGGPAAYYSGAPSGTRRPTAAVVDLAPLTGATVQAAVLQGLNSG